MLGVLAVLVVLTQQTPQRVEPRINQEKGSRHDPQQPTHPPRDSTSDLLVTPLQVNPPHRRPVSPYDQEQQQAQIPDSWIYRLTTDPIATFTALLFGATVGLWAATWCLVAESKKTAHRQLRAYVGAQGMIYKAQIQDDGRVVIVLTNHGQTPAFRCQCWTDWEVVEAQPLRQCLFTGDRQTMSLGTMMPRSGRRVTIPLKTLEINARTRLTDDRVRLFITGGLTYRDAFDVERQTPFSFQFGGEAGTGHGRLAMTEDGNEAD